MSVKFFIIQAPGEKLTAPACHLTKVKAEDLSREY
jgi:hypothetical protein